MNPVSNRRRLQDEASKIHADIEALRSASPASDQEQADNLGRLGELEARADAVSAELERENATDERLARMTRAASNAADRRGPDEGDQAKPQQLASFGRTVYSDEARLLRVSQYLRGLRDGTVNARALTETGSAGAGPELNPPVDLYNEIVNVINRQSIGAQLALTLNTNSRTVDVPKLGNVTADFVAEATAPTPQDPTTSKVSLTVYDAKAEVDVSNNLLDDSPIDVASYVTQFIGNAYAKFYDQTWLAGHAGNSIAGLYAGIAAGRKATVAVGSTISAANVGAVIGSIDPMVMGDFAWVVSAAGWGQLLALEGTRFVQPMVGGGAPTMSVWGVPVFKTDALPANVLAVYGAYRMTTALAMRKELSVTPLRELKARENQTVFLAHGRFGLSNHGPEYAGAIVQATS
jgi:HK97 family phage major capsid protein